jgi:hypothetical protein
LCLNLNGFMACYVFVRFDKKREFWDNNRVMPLNVWLKWTLNNLYRKDIGLVFITALNQLLHLWGTKHDR